ncbi:hypothetical protein PIB30_114656, partial [Stylosanthes scabra]|nr:hypothetical protein [Stylosanthes scabra]
MTRMPGKGVTCSLRCPRKNDQASFVSPSTIANAIGNMFELPSWAMAISKVPPYLPYKWVPSMEIRGLQCLNASTQGET